MEKRKKKIVFVLNSVTISRCQKRVQEFIDNGYDVDVYGFDRGGESHSATTQYGITTIGYHPVEMGYLKRLLVILKSLKNLHNQYKDQRDVVFYYFFFDVAFAASLISRRPFIYEESDLPYTNLSIGFLRWLFGNYDKKLIKKSQLTIMTSEGFIDYHFGDKRPNNIIVIPNRVNPKLLELEYKPQKVDIEHIAFAFVGGFRYKSIINFATVIAEHFPQHSFHAFGVIYENKEEINALCEKYNNIHCHGKFNNPEDLPSVYEQVDIVLATYDASTINARFAEPNKLYESIYFRTPILVSSNTYLARKVTDLGIGYHINALEKDEIIRFVNGLSAKSIEERHKALDNIPVDYAINSNVQLFSYLENAGI